MPKAALNGTEINYAGTGGDGPVVVLSHGFLMDQSMFAPQVKALAPEFRVLTWDQRGHGWDQSGQGGTPARGPFSYWDSARDLLALLDHLGVQRAVLGTSPPLAAPIRTELGHWSPCWPVLPYARCDLARSRCRCGRLAFWPWRWRDPGGNLDG
ncbi:MAG TPA: alpha/beta hydrolase [Streptosporangiaceae bacterium]|jgi:hypothetical protein|nr:alpha/beta hydrolase [Streptosporangiaceae bacterium]